MKNKEIALSLFNDHKYDELISFIDSHIEKDYYWFLLLKIKTLMQVKKYEQAYSLVKEELALPYIPQPYNNKLLKWENKISMQLDLTKSEKILSPKEIATKLTTLKEENDLIALVPTIKNFNLRLFIKEFKLIFSSPNYDNLKILLFILLKEQKIKDVFKVNIKNKLISINVDDLQFPNTHPFYKTIQPLITKAFYKNPGPKKVFIQLIDEYFWKNVFLFKTYDDPKKTLFKIHLQVFKMFEISHNLVEVEKKYK